MGSRLPDLPGGVLIPSRLTLTNLAPNDGTATGSSYSESTPRPGSPVPGDARNRLRLEVSNGQGEDLDFVVVRGGMPGRDGCSVAYRMGSDTDSTDYRGWNPPVWIEGWKPLAWSTTISYQEHDAVTIPSSQRVVVVARRNDTNYAETWRVGVDQSTTKTVGTMPPTAFWLTPSLCILPSERILCLYGGVMYYSDDEGDTWSLYSQAPFGVTPNGKRTRMVCHRGQILLITTDNSGDVRHYASSDLGVSFKLVETVSSFGADFSLMSTPTALIVVYSEDTTLYPQCIRLGSAFEPLSRAAVDAVEFATRFSSGTLGRTLAWADPDGVMWAWVCDADDAIYCFQSIDDGQTWTECHGIPYLSGSSSDRMVPNAIVSSAGRAVVCHFYQASTASYDNSLAVAFFGGWSSVTTGPPIGMGTWDPTVRVGSAGYQSTLGTPDVTGRVWLPWELPSDGGGWTAAGTGSAAVVTSAGWMDITTATGVNRYFSRNVSAGRGALIMAELAVNGGGSVSSQEVAIKIQVADGTNDFDLAVQLSDSGFTVRDLHGSTDLATVAADLADPMQFIVQVTESGVAYVWHRRPGASLWTVDVSATQLTSNTATPFGDGRAIFGHWAINQAADTSWRMVVFVTDTGTVFPRLYSGVFSGFGSIYGRPISSVPTAIPEAMDTEGRACHIAAAAGPARQVDTLTVACEHDFPVDAVFGEVSPSPSAKWRSEDASEQILTFDLGARSYLGVAVGLFVAQANFRTAYLEYHTTGTTWVPAATLDLATGFTALNGSLTGNIVHPRSGTTEGGRYLWEGELVGGHVILTSGGTTVYRRIVGQTAGGWTTATTVQPQVRITGVDGTEPASNTCTLVHHTGLAVAYAGSLQHRQHWRIRIPAQETPEGYFEAGILAAGRIQPWGARVDWSRSDASTPNATVSRDASGTSRVRERGPLARTWTISWQDGVHHRHIRSGVDLDYHSITSGGLPLVVQDDVLHLVAGIIRETRSGEVPVVVIEELPATSGVITDPSRFLYSRIATGVRWNGVQGDLGIDEIGRIEAVTFEEVV